MDINQLLSDENPSFSEGRQANQYIRKAIGSERAKLVGRFGSIEGRVVGHYLLGLSDKNDHVLTRVAQSNAGICRPNARNLMHFSCEYLAAAAHADLLAAWDFPHQPQLIDIAQPSKVCRLSSIDPVFQLSRGHEPWSMALRAKRVLVIHPFKQTILQQYSRRTHDAFLRSVLPEFEIEVIVPPVTTGEDQTYPHPWRHYLDALKRQVSDCRFDVAIIGAGSYGLPIASFIKSLGKTAIHLGGVTQLMFGIMGKRWEDERYIKKLNNSNWVRPSADETPAYAGKIEGGCYW